MPGKLILVRHGQSTWNVENLFTGWHDVDLSDLGRQEAKSAGVEIKKAGIVPGNPRLASLSSGISALYQRYYLTADDSEIREFYEKQILSRQEVRYRDDAACEAGRAADRADLPAHLGFLFDARSNCTSSIRGRLGLRAAQREQCVVSGTNRRPTTLTPQRGQ